MQKYTLNLHDFIIIDNHMISFICMNTFFSWFLLHTQTFESARCYPINKNLPYNHRLPQHNHNIKALLFQVKYSAMPNVK